MTAASSQSPAVAVECYKIYCATVAIHRNLLQNHCDTIYDTIGQTQLQVLCPPDFQRTTSIHPHIDIPLILKLARTKWLASIIIYIDTSPSTQDILRKIFHSLRCPGILAITNKQTGGRGRRGSSWSSPEGALTFSIRLPIREDPKKLVFLQYIAALAIAECLSRYKGWDKLPLRIKWPNDVLLDDIKVGGILCETVMVDQVFWVTLGIGINLFNDYPTASLNTALKKIDPNAKLLKKETFLIAFLESFEKIFDIFNKFGFNPLKERYLSKWIHSGQLIRLEKFEGKEGQVVGLSKDGFIRIRISTENGDEFVELEPDSTSFDFAKGIIRDKT